METILSPKGPRKNYDGDLSAMRFIGETRRTIITVESSFLLPYRPVSSPGRPRTRCRRGEERRTRGLIPREKAPPPLDKCPPNDLSSKKLLCASFCSVRQTQSCSLLGSALFLCGLYGDSVSFCRPREVPLLSFAPSSYCVPQFDGRFVISNRSEDLFSDCSALRDAIINLSLFCPVILTLCDRAGNLKTQLGESSILN